MAMTGPHNKVTGVDGKTPTRPKKQTTKQTSDAATGATPSPAPAVVVPDYTNSLSGSIYGPSGQSGGPSTGLAGSPTTNATSTPITSNGSVSSAISPSSVAAGNVAQAQMAATPGPSPANSGYNQGTTTPITGQLAGYGYSPQGLAGLYDNPQDLANQILQGMGITNPALAYQLGQSLDPAVAANVLLNNGYNSSDNDTLNFAAQYLQNLATPGGRTVDFSALVNHLLGPGGEMKLDANGNLVPANPLAAYLNASLDPSQQVQAANALFGQTLGGLNPYAQQAYSRYAKDMGSQYQGALARGATDYKSYIDYLNQVSDLGRWAGRG